MLFFAVSVLSLNFLIANSQIIHLVDYLEQNNYTTLVDLIKKAGLASTLATAGPFTIFAPTDAAFAKLPQSLLDRLSTDPRMLTDTLKFHVLNGFVVTPMLQEGSMFPTLFTGHNLTSHRYDNGKIVVIQGVKVGDENKVTANGIIHEVNSVLFPATVSISEYLGTHDTQFSDLYAALVLEGLEQPLESGMFTIFAPKDEAFARILSNLPTIAADDNYFKKILQYHVVPGVWFSAGLTYGLSLPTLAGKNITIDIKGSNIFLESAMVVEADKVLTNGCLHVIDDVLAPPN